MKIMNTSSLLQSKGSMIIPKIKFNSSITLMLQVTRIKVWDAAGYRIKN